MATGWRVLILVAILIHIPIVLTFVTHSFRVKTIPGAILGRSLEVAPDALDLGVVDPDASIQHTISISNRASFPIAISDFQTSCQCTAVSPASLTIAPGRSESVDVHVHIPRIATRGIDGIVSQREVTVQVMPVINGERGATWNLTARVYQPFQVPDWRISLGDVSHSAPRRLEHRATVYVPESLNDVSGYSDPPLAQLTVVRSETDPRQYLVTIVSEPSDLSSLSLGRHVFKVHMQGTDQRAEIIRGNAFECSVRVVPDVAASPESLVLQTLKDRPGLAGRLQLHSRSGSQFQVTKFGSDFADLHLERQSGDRQSGTGALNPSKSEPVNFQLSMPADKAPDIFSSQCWFEIQCGQDKQPVRLVVPVHFASLPD